MTIYSKVKIGSHPLHVMLVSFPVAFYTATVVCFITYKLNMDNFWFKVAVIANCTGFATGALAAIPGFIDWLNIPKNKMAKKTGLKHMLCNVTALVLFGINIYIVCTIENENAPDVTASIVITSLGFLLTVVAGFLGWSLVQKHHVGISLTPQQQQIEPAEGVN